MFHVKHAEDMMMERLEGRKLCFLSLCYCDMRAFLLNMLLYLLLVADFVQRIDSLVDE